ncbi:MAG: hypothetical protein IKU25_02840 [Clostridia bacterium]|nr:hypothetical protein [Clostridia bacterium]
MTITKNVINRINAMISDEPPESGGIIGEGELEIISEVIFDVRQAVTPSYCFYSPNVEFLNSKIEVWQRENILFRGLFHTHFGNTRSLSVADKKYIIEIMNNMPECIQYLYFPIFVLPDREFVVYKAEKNNNGLITIVQDGLTIV